MSALETLTRSVDALSVAVQADIARHTDAVSAADALAQAARIDAQVAALTPLAPAPVPAPEVPAA